MVSMQEIRKDLREIRYYYAKQKDLDKASKEIAENAISEKVNKYNQVIKNAPVRLFDLYISLYTQNNTQAALAYDWDLSEDYIKQLNKQLCLYLYQSFNGDNDYGK